MTGVPHGCSFDGLLLPWARLLLACERQPIKAQVPPQRGLYSLHYTDDEDPLYELIPAEWPVYLGATFNLRDRLYDHRTSLARAGIDLERVSVRLLPTDTPWLHTVEAFLIDHFQPPWNVILPGFGSKSPRRRGQPWVPRRLSSDDLEEYRARLCTLPHYPLK
jgi:hypothetical protein